MMLDPAISAQIRVPVLLVLGQEDSLMCNEALGLSCANEKAILAREQHAYAGAAKLEAYVQPIAGHSTNLHPNARKSYRAMLDWADKHNL